MKILTEKDQLRNKLNELDKAIEYCNKEVRNAHKRKIRREYWGIFSMQIKERWFLQFEYDSKKSLVRLLEEYKDELSDRLCKVK